MKIISLELKGYNRLALRGINYVKYTPESIMQLIIGSNGSGKSSLMKELSPLPAIPAEFQKDGFKSIEITSNGHHYLLQSIFSPQGNKFHFIKDGVEINEGHTVTVYKDLCKIEFGITQEVMNFLLGEKGFCAMSPKDRRALFTTVADVDYEYAIKYYQRLSSQLRDTVGAIRETKKKLQAEAAKKLTSEEEESLRKEVDLLRSKIGLAIENKPRARANFFDVRSNLDKSLRDIESTISELESIRRELWKNTEYKDYKDASARMQQYQKERDSAFGIYEYIGKTLMDKQRQIEESKELAGKDLNKYLDERVSLRKNIQQLQQEIQIESFDKFDDPEQSLSVLTNCKESFVRLVKELPPNRERKFTKAFYEASKLQIQYHQDQIRDLERNISLVSARIDDLKHKAEHADIVCPKCNNRWKEGFSQTKLDEFIATKSSLEEKLNKTKEDLQLNQRNLEECTDYFTKYLNLQNFVKSYPGLSHVWTYIFSTSVIMDSPESIESIVQKCYSDLELRVMIKDLTERLNENQKWVEALEARSKSEVDEDKEYLQIENQYWVIGEKLSALDRQIQNTDWYLKLCDAVEHHRDTLQKQIQYHQDQSQMIDDVMKTEFLNEVLMDLNLKLTERESLLSKTNVQNGIVDSLNSQLNDLETRRRLLDMACKELSPTTGLIAKGLTGFINHFILQMNSFIKKIWTYPMELCLVNMEEDALDLDYKFEMIVSDGKPLPDVSNGSSAQKEIVDLAFRIVAMSYMKMANYPLFLDEFGAKFDSGHRHMAFSVITSIIATAGFSQIFMISHDEHSYGSLHNCDINVLCDANVVIPEGAVTNKHLLLK